MLFEALKLVHVSSAIASITGFALRGYWMITENPLLRHRLTRIVPHIVDTLLLGTALGMLLLWQANPFELEWLRAKIIALLAYIGLGMVALRFGKTKTVRYGALALALMAAGYIVSVAYTKSALGLASSYLVMAR